MDLLLRCNQRLVSSGLDEALVLQQTLVQIVIAADGCGLKLKGFLNMATPSAKMLVLACKDFVCVKIVGRANFTYGPDFKTLLTELVRKGCDHFIIDLSECALMDSTFLGILAGFGLKLNKAGAPDNHGIELLNPNSRIADLLENLGALHLFKVTTGTLQLPGDVRIPGT